MMADKFKSKLFFYPIYIYILSIIYIVTSYSILKLGEDVLKMSIHEDTYFEVVGAIGFFITAVLFFISYLFSRRITQKPSWSWFTSFIFLGLTLLFLFGAGEEISWGQRILNIKTPESLAALNMQDEINLHNLLVIDDRFFNPHRLFNIFWFGFTVILPLVYALVPFIRNFIIKRFGKFAPIPHLSIGLLFFFNYLWAKLAKIIYAGRYSYKIIPFKQAVQEIKESNYAILFLLVSLHFVLVYHQSKRETRGN